jgi:hypothetical protein
MREAVQGAANETTDPNGHLLPTHPLHQPDANHRWKLHT